MNDKGTLVISIDYEFAWGFCDIKINEKNRKKIIREREVTKAILSLFTQYKIQATWAVVGHLFLDKCTWLNTKPHPEFPHSVFIKSKVDWFFQHPKEFDEIWHAPDAISS